MILDISDSTFKRIFSDESFFLPIRWDGRDFPSTLDKLFCDYRKQVCDALPYADIKQLRNDCNLIIKAVKYYLNGFPSKAYNSIDTLMTRLIQSPLKIYHKTASELFSGELCSDDPLKLFRVAAVNDNIPYDRTRVFHTPYNLRSKVSTNRYSIAGYPSLYLGTSLELCCEEIHLNPHEGFALASRFQLDRYFEQNDRPIDVIELSIKPQDFLSSTTNRETPLTRRRIGNIFTYNNSVRSAYLSWYPLIAACSYIRVNKKDPFAAEYIVPQLLMQWVRSEMAPSQKSRDSEERLIGIRYFSCASIRASNMGVNYVFPVSSQQLPDQPYCSVLAHAFKLTAPRYVHEYNDIAACEAALVNDRDIKYIFNK